MNSIEEKYTYQLQIASLHDFTEIVEVWEASVRATHHFLKEEDILYFKPLILNEYLEAVDLWKVLDDKNRIVGFLGTSEDSIEMLFVHPDHRGKGAGKMLIKHAIQQLNTRFVDVNEQNEQAVGFYKKMGFVTVNRSEKDGTGKPYPLLHMELKQP